ncbi:diacylglycerol O-acyltransferase [Spizellomyces sp. 'palustris']|nr:diacylglycerol O-acyltransferase [Spizellomyces sp. 'palustris']
MATVLLETTPENPAVEACVEDMKTRNPPRRRTVGGQAKEEKREASPHVQGSPKRQEKLSTYSHTYVVHTAIRASPLSKGSPEQDYRGFLNLALLLLAVSNIRLIIENYMKYGFLLSHPFSNLRLSDIQWALFSWACQGMSVLAAYATEKWATRDIRTDRPTRKRVRLIYFINIGLAITVPTLIAYTIWNPAISALSLFSAAILMLKLVSYGLVCADMRRDAAWKIVPHRCEDLTSKDARLNTTEFDINMTYPLNITLGNLLYFVFCPTLCYQPVYPRTPRFRSSFFFKRLMEFSIGMAAIYLLGVQYAAPTLRNSLQALDKLDFVHLVERVLKLSVISVVIWLLMFYCFFHCALNMLAEVMRFGDRRFYLTWWNAKDIAEYWRLWNTPVHNWGKRHIYMPLIIKHKVPPMGASIAVFTFSAILHELLIGVPTRCVNGWAFWGMMIQLPLILQTRAFEPLRRRNEKLFDTIGNYMFWISFTIGLFIFFIFFWE